MDKRKHRMKRRKKELKIKDMEKFLNGIRIVFVERMEIGTELGVPEGKVRVKGIHCGNY